MRGSHIVDKIKHFIYFKINCYQFLRVIAVHDSRIGPYNIIIIGRQVLLCFYFISLKFSLYLKLIKIIINKQLKIQYNNKIL